MVKSHPHLIAEAFKGKHNLKYRLLLLTRSSSSRKSTDTSDGSPQEEIEVKSDTSNIINH